MDFISAQCMEAHQPELAFCTFTGIVFFVVHEIKKIFSIKLKVFNSQSLEIEKPLASSGLMHNFSISLEIKGLYKLDLKEL